MEKNRDERSTYRQIGPYLGLGTQLAATIVIMVFLGKWIDDSYDTSPLWLLICSFFGAFAGMYNFINAVIKEEKKQKNSDGK